MAPQKGQPRPPKATVQVKRQHPSAVASRPVVIPALPLTMIPKPTTKANKQAPTHSSTNGFPASSLEAALADHTIHTDRADAANGAEGAKALQAAKNTEKVVNGSSVEKPEHIEATTTPTNGSHHIANQESNASSPANGANGIDNLNGRSGPGMPFAAAGGDRTVGPASASLNEAIQAHSVSQPQSATSTRPDLQLPFHHPATHPMQHQLSTDQQPNPANFNGPPHMNMNRMQHHTHMNNGGAGVVFGGFSGSHTSSPAPPSAGFYPPPPPLANGENRMHPQTNGHHHGQPNGNGVPVPIDTQFRPEMLPASTIETFGQAPAPGPPQTFGPFSPTVGPYGLSTPHSFHGSHASGEPSGVENGAGNGAMPPYMTNGIPYAGHGHHEHPVPPFMPLQPFPRHPGSFDDGLREHIRHFQDQFDSGELTDCTLELVSTKQLHHPVKISGHRFIFALSPALKQNIMAARAKDSSSHTITIESDDPYLRSDAWWSAVRHLYLHPLVNPGMMDSAASGLRFDGDKVDRFKFCLGYAAAGHLLNMHDIFMRGLCMAADFITWATVEQALGFVFEGTTQRHVNYDNEQSFELDFSYGPEVRLILDAAMVFLINEFPPNFELDASVADPPKFARIPATAAAAMTPPPQNDPAPSTSRGSNMRKSNRLSNIKFGDLPAAFPEDGSAPQRGPAKCSPVLSRILLNLPFEELRAVLTSESNGVSGWNTAQDRYHAVADVVAQRETRRLRAVGAVRAGAVPRYHEIQQRLSAQRRHAIVEPWDVLNWQEQVVQPRGEIPRLERRWVPHFSVDSETSQQHLQSQHHNVHDSMV